MPQGRPPRAVVVCAGKKAAGKKAGKKAAGEEGPAVTIQEHPVESEHLLITDDFLPGKTAKGLRAIFDDRRAQSLDVHPCMLWSIRARLSNCIKTIKCCWHSCHTAAAGGY